MGKPREIVLAEHIYIAASVHFNAIPLVVGTAPQKGRPDDTGSVGSSFHKGIVAAVMCLIVGPACDRVVGGIGSSGDIYVTACIDGNVYCDIHISHAYVGGHVLVREHPGQGLLYLL